MTCTECLFLGIVLGAVVAAVAGSIALACVWVNRPAAPQSDDDLETGP
jgi:hypothetical protein